MVDEVLRLRATVVSTEALANIRAIGREIGIIPRTAGRGVATVNSQFAILGKTIQGVGRELTAVVPALSGFGLGAAGVGIAAGAMIKTLGDTAKKIVELRYASKELGMSEQALRGWSSAAQKAGIAPEAMMQSLTTFKRNTEDFSLRIGNVREEMVKLGAGPVLARINAAATQTDKLKEAFDFKEVLMESDPSGMKARRFFEMIGLGAQAARLSWVEFKAEQERHPILTEKEKEDAKKYADLLVDMGTEWDKLKVKVGVTLFPWLQDAITGWEIIIDRMKSVAPVVPAITPEEHAARRRGSAVGGEAARDAQQQALQQGLEEQARQMREQRATPGKQSGLYPGFQRASYVEGGSGENSASRIIKIGVFDALVEFKAYVEGGAAGGGGGGGGYQKASLGGASNIGGAGGGGGGGGGGGDGGQSAPRPGPDGQAAPGPGGPGGITAPAGTPIKREGLATVTSASGRKFQVDARYKDNFQGFIDDYEKAGGELGPDTGTLGSRPHNASGHPIGTAIDINQIGRGVRSRRAKSLDPAVEDALAQKWGLVSGNKWRSNDQGHFGIQSPERAQQALIEQNKRLATPNGQQPDGAKVPAGEPSGATAPNGQQQSQYDIFRAAAVKAGVKDPDMAAAIAMHESGSGKRGTGSVFDRSGGTNPFGQTVKKGTPGAVIGRDGQPHATYGSLEEGFQHHQSRWGSLYGSTPEETARNLVRRGYNSTDPGWAAKVQAIRAREMARRAEQNRVAGAVAPGAASGQVNVTVHSNGTKADATAKKEGDLFQEPKVQQHRQMQPTEDAGGRISI